jgi:lactoylglutathione lyase
MITRIDKVTIYVVSLEEAKRFWSEKMGFVVTVEREIGPDTERIEVSPRVKTSLH